MYFWIRNNISETTTHARINSQWRLQWTQRKGGFSPGVVIKLRPVPGDNKVAMYGDDILLWEKSRSLDKIGDNL